MQKNLRGRFSRALYDAFEKQGANAELLSIIGSLYDTLDDEKVVSMLEHYNKTGSAMECVFCSVDGSETPKH